MQNLKNILVVALGFLALCVNTEKAFAISEEFKPQGAIVGSFLVFPKVEVKYSSDDNIYATEKDSVSDEIVAADVDLLIVSDWANHELNIRGSGEIASYSQKSDENYSDVAISADGRIDILRDVNIFYGAGYQGLHEERGSVDDVLGKEPTIFRISTANIGYSHAVSTITLQLNGKWDQYDYDNTRVSEGADINNEDRNRTQQEASIRLGYKIDRNYEAFIQGVYYARDYDEELDRNGLDRSSDGYSVAAGVKLDFTGVTAGEFFVGARTQDYDDDALDSINGLDFGASLFWTPSELTEVTVFVERTVEETITSVASGYFSTLYGVNVDHSMLDNLLLYAGLSGNKWEFEGVDRTDNILEAKIGVDYYAVRYFYLGVEYTHKNRESSLNGLDYTSNVLMLRVGAQL